MSDWGLFHQRLRPLVKRLVFVSLAGAFGSGFLLALENIYSSIAAYFLIAVSLASVGYDAALGHIHLFARNSYEQSDLSSSVLISSSAPKQFSDKYNYQVRPAIAATKLYLSILSSCFWGFVILGIALILGALFGYFILNMFQEYA